MGKSYSRVATAGALWSVAREGLNELIAIPVTVIMARLLTPEEFGITAAASLFLRLSARLTQFGFNAALVRMKAVSPDHASSVFALNLGTGVLVWGGLTATAPFIARFFNSPDTALVLPVAALSFLIVPFSTVPSAILTREMRFREAATVDWMQTLTNAVVAVGLAWAGFSYWSIVYGHLAANVVLSSANMYYARWRPSLRLSRAKVRELLSFGLGVYAKRVLDYVASNADTLLVGRFMGVASLGLYDKAFTTAERLVSRISVTGPGVSFRIFAVIQDDPERLRRGYSKVLLPLTLVSYSAFAALIVVAHPLFRLLFGERWLAAVPAFQLLCGAGALRLLNVLASTVAQAKGSVWPEVQRQVAYLALIVTGIILLRDWGITGAAGAVLAASACMSVLMHVMLKRLIGFTWRDFFGAQVPALGCAGGLVLVLLGTRALIGAVTWNVPFWLVLLAQLVAGGIWCVAFLARSPFPAVRPLVAETVAGFPAPARRLFTALRLRISIM